jgi:predicted nucleotidyltransferase
MEIINKKINQQIKKIALENGLDLVVLFGSFAKGNEIKESDIDIGIFRKTGGLTFDDQVVLNHKFAELFKNINIDVSIISPNNPVLMFSILKYGKILFTTENKIADTLRLYAWKLMMESKYFRDHSFYLLKNRIMSLS